MRVAELVQATGYPIRVVRGDANDYVVDEVVVDSRRAGPGRLFVALEGERVDAHRFVPAALEAGAAVLLREGREPEGVDGIVLGVDDTRAALAPLAAAFHGHPTRELKVCGITGTNGKTTTSYLLEWVLAERFPTGVVGTVNYRWPGRVINARNTTPESLVVQSLAREMADDGVEALVMEVSSHGLETHRVDAVDFDVAIFTNLTQDHLDFHASMEAYRDAKARLFVEHLGPGSVAVLNVDDAEGQRLLGMLPEGVDSLTYGASGDFSATNLCADLDGLTFQVEFGGEKFDVRSSMVGDYNVSNILATLAASHALGIPLAAASRRLSSFPGVPGRLQKTLDTPATFVDYAHTPDALAASLNALRPVTPGTLWVVFGCGGDRDQGKRPLMGAVAVDLADHVIATSDNPRHENPQSIIDDIVRGVETDIAWVDVDRETAIRWALDHASSDDVVLIAGKGHETYQEIGDDRRDFDDREVVRRWAVAR